MPCENIEFVNTLTTFAELETDEEETVKRYVENEKKRALVRAKQNANVMHKLIVKRLTIEGEHTYLLVIRGTDKEGAADLYLEPLVNSPHHPPCLSIQVSHLLYALPYTYLATKDRALRLVTSDLNDYLLLTKDA